jgi:UDPglucose 6-dehydrogenase
MFDLCKKLGLNYETIKECVVADKRIGDSHLDIFHDGYRGYKGACFPKDIRSLIQFGEKIGVPLELLKKVEEINNRLLDRSKPQ